MMKYKVILGSILAFSLLGAEVVQDNIKKEINTDVLEAKTSPIATEKKTKTGILAGVELGLGGGRGRGEIEEQGGSSMHGYNNNDITSFAFNTKIFGGYQKYFGDNEILGFDVKGSFGIGFLNHDIKIGDVCDADSSYNLKAGYVPVIVGFEANFLFDFFQKAEHTVGLNVGVGYSFVYGINTSIKIPNNSLVGEITNQFADKNTYYSLISPKIGIHYYYDRHQFGFNFSFDKAFGETNNSNNVSEPGGEEGIVTVKIRPNYFYTFNLSYAYRF